MLQVPAVPATERNKISWAILVGLATVAIYAIAGVLAEGLEPRLLPLSALDRAVPLLPGTIWIYLSIYFVYASSCILQRDMKAYGKFLSSYLVAYTGSTILFLAFPTTFPRDLYPATHGAGASLSESALYWFRLWDRPTNCFPSMHVASAVLATLPFRGRRPGLFVAFSIWSVLIGITTITTKQHYAADVVAGALFGWLCHHVAFRGDTSDDRGPRPSLLPTG